MGNKKDTAVSKGKVEKKAKKNKKPNIFVRAWGKIKEIFSELKKVTWPSFSTVMKQLGCVLVIVVLVLAIVMLMDLGLGYLLKLIKPAASALATIGVL
ncbi:MAG: preprotein translocase subunit SecE [Clostridia bacterium]|nr:preprotein translocase subunit SecE [Clostridia bacterium]